MTTWSELNPTAVQRFHKSLVTRIEESGRSQADISREIGSDPRTISRWMRLGTLPSLKLGAALADALGDQMLLRELTWARTLDCRSCGKRFVAAVRPNPYHSEICGMRAHRRRYRTKTKTHELRMAREESRRLDAAVKRFCHRCEPLGVCMTPTCELRNVSPLPLGKRKAS